MNRTTVPVRRTRRRFQGLATGRSVLFAAALVLALEATASPSRAESPSPAPDAQAGKETNPAADAPAAGEASGGKASTAVTPMVADRLLRANKHLDEGRYDDALAIINDLRDGGKKKPVDEAQIRRFRGYILLAKGDPNAAATDFEAALATGVLDAGSKQAMIYSLAQIYAQAGKYDRARKLLDSWFATEKDPKPEAWFLKAMLLAEEGNYKEALQPAKIANQRSPEPRESWLQLLVSIQFELSEYRDLADTLRRLVALSPGQKRYWVQLATVESTIGKDKEALASISIAHEAGLLVEDKEIRQRARMCFARELPDCCVRTLEEGLAAGTVKPDVDAYRLLANCRIAGREIKEALEPLAKAAELGDGSRSWLLLGQLQLEREDWAGARVALQKALTGVEPGKRASVELLLGVAMLGSKDFDGAEKEFRAAAADEKTRPSAEGYLRHLEQQRALQQLREASTAPPGGKAGA